MTIRVDNLFTTLPEFSKSEQALTLLENSAIKIQRIVSRSYSSPADFWYDQDDDEWVVLVRGDASLEFEHGELVRMTEGDYVTIPRHMKHRVRKTGPTTVWLAVHVRP